MEFRHKYTSLVDEAAVAEIAGRAAEYMGHLRRVAEAKDWSAPEASLCLLDDDEMLAAVEKLRAEKASPALRHVLLIGIGGSNLGFKALYESMYLYADEYRARAPRVHFLDTVSPAMLEKALRLVGRTERPEELLVIAVAKSGSTTETAYNLEAVYAELSKKLGDAAPGRCVFITGKDSNLWKAAEASGISTLEIPASVGGRYSVFSPAGLFPLAVTGHNARLFLDSACAMRDACLADGGPALASAAAVFEHYRKGKRVNDTFVFNSELESLGKWYRQLMAESLGKRTDREGKEVRAGMLPTVTVGTTDLHSVAQLYFGGPQERLTTFVSLDRADTPAIAGQRFSLVPSLDGRSAGDVLGAIREATKAAYRNEKMPFMEARIEEYEAAAFMQFKMIEVMILGFLMNVNAFDQPAVELYKSETRRILNGN